MFVHVCGMHLFNYIHKVIPASQPADDADAAEGNGIQMNNIQLEHCNAEPTTKIQWPNNLSLARCMWLWLFACGYNDIHLGAGGRGVAY